MTRSSMHRRNLREVSVPLRFGLSDNIQQGTVNGLFSGRKGEEFVVSSHLLSTVAICGDYFAPDLTGRAHDALPDPSVRWVLSHPHSPPLSSMDPKGLVHLLNWYPHVLDQSYAPGSMRVIG